MTKEYTLREFIQLTPPQKERLRVADPEQYKELFYAVQSQFPTEEDPSAGVDSK